MDHSATNRDTLAVSPSEFSTIHRALAVAIVKIPGFLMPSHLASFAETSWFDDDDEEYDSDIESSVATSEDEDVDEEDDYSEVDLETAKTVEMFKVPKFLLPPPILFGAKDPLLPLHSPLPQRATKVHEALVKNLERISDNEDNWNAWYVSNISLEQHRCAEEADWSGHMDYTDWMVDRKHYPEAESIFDLEMNEGQFRNPFQEDRQSEHDVEAFEHWVEANDEGDLIGWGRSLPKEVAMDTALLGMLARLEEHSVISPMPWNAISPSDESSASDTSSEDLDVADYFSDFDEYFDPLRCLDYDFGRPMSPTSMRFGAIGNPFISEFDDDSRSSSSSDYSFHAEEFPVLDDVGEQSLLAAEDLLNWINEWIAECITSDITIEFFSSLEIEALVSEYESAAVLEDHDWKHHTDSFTFFDLSPHAPRMGCHCYHCQDGPFGRHAGLLDKISAHTFSEWCFCVQCKKQRKVNENENAEVERKLIEKRIKEQEKQDDQKRKRRQCRIGGYSMIEKMLMKGKWEVVELDEESAGSGVFDTIKDHLAGPE